MLAGVEALRRIVGAAVAPFIAEEIEPGPACASDDELLDYMRRRGSTVYHPISTCRMGRTPRRWSTSGSRCAASSGCA